MEGGVKIHVGHTCNDKSGKAAGGGGVKTRAPGGRLDWSSDHDLSVLRVAFPNALRIQ